MNGPKLVCAGCAAPTSLGKPVCDDCMGLFAEIGHPVCPLCNSSLYGEPKVQPADKFGIHYTKAGGYAGRCSATSSEPRTVSK